MKRRIFEGKQSGEEEEEGLEYKIYELIKFTGVGRPYPE